MSTTEIYKQQILDYFLEIHEEEDLCKQSDLELIKDGELIGVIYFRVNSFYKYAEIEHSEVDGLSKKEIKELEEFLYDCVENKFNEFNKEYDEWDEHGFSSETDYWNWKGY